MRLENSPSNVAATDQLLAHLNSAAAVVIADSAASQFTTIDVAEVLEGRGRFADPQRHRRNAELSIDHTC